MKDGVILRVSKPARMASMMRHSIPRSLACRAACVRPVTKSKRVTKLAVTKMGRAAASLGLFPLATLSPCCLPAACVRRGYEKQACYEIGCYENGTAVLALEHKDGWLHGHWVRVTCLVPPQLRSVSVTKTLLWHRTLRWRRWKLTCPKRAARCHVRG